MDSPEYTFADLAEFIRLVARFPPVAWAFRGQADASWALTAKAGRPKYFVKANDFWRQKGQTSCDLGRFHAWREQAIAFCRDLPSNDFECLALAQHYGLATRLLDWSSNPLAALFFAVEDRCDVDGAVYCHSAQTLVVPDQVTPEQLTVVARYDPRPFDRRILVQGGLFTCHPKPEVALRAESIQNGVLRECSGVDVNLVAIRVGANTKAILQRQLRDVAISRKTLFPDLQGLSEFVNCETSSLVDFETHHR